MTASEKQVSISKIIWVFLAIGPPTFAPIFYFAADVVHPNGDTIFTKFNEALLVVFSLVGLMATYAIGFVPALVSGFAYSKSRRLSEIASHRLGIAALIGAIVYCLVCGATLVAAFGVWVFAVCAAGAGAVSAFLCAMVVEVYLNPSSGT